MIEIYQTTWSHNLANSNFHSHRREIMSLVIVMFVNIIRLFLVVLRRLRGFSARIAISWVHFEEGFISANIRTRIASIVTAILMVIITVTIIASFYI
jgi:hypothetical protein